MIKAAMAGQKQAKIGRGARGVAETLFEGATRGRSGACVCVCFFPYTPFYVQKVRAGRSYFKPVPVGNKGP